MKKIAIKRIQDEIIQATESWKSISVTMSSPPNGCQPLQNRQCMHNAYNEVIAGRAVCMLEVVAADSGCVFAHYLCMTESGDIYDPTLGYQWSNTRYKLSKYMRSAPDNTWMCDRLNQFKGELYAMTSKKTKVMCKLLTIKYLDVL